MAHRIYGISFASVYPHYVAKAEKGLKRAARGDSADLDPGRAKDMVDEVIRWLTGYSQEELEQALAEMAPNWTNRSRYRTFVGRRLSCDRGHA
jgi:hypothetical protein